MYYVHRISIVIIRITFMRYMDTAVLFFFSNKSCLQEKRNGYEYRSPLGMFKKILFLLYTG